MAKATIVSKAAVAFHNLKADISEIIQDLREIGLISFKEKMQLQSEAASLCTVSDARSMKTELEDYLNADESKGEIIVPVAEPAKETPKKSRNKKSKK